MATMATDRLILTLVIITKPRKASAPRDIRAGIHPEGEKNAISDVLDLLNLCLFPLDLNLVYVYLLNS